MTAPTTPCYGCHDRSAICHAQCTKYQDWLAEIRAIKDNVRAERIGDRLANERLMDVSAKRQRRNHMQGRRGK